ncbi:MAG: TetR/AcrR family transcriptional regulator [Gemmatimonadales bacterium]
MAKAVPRSGAGTASFRAWVADKQRAAGPRRKGERTRDRIRLAAVDLLNESGYRQLKVADVCDRAGITPPVLYLYFDTKVALVLEVLTEFLDRFIAQAVEAGGGTAYQTIFQANLQWVRLARANAGLMGCLLEVADEVPEFATLFREASRGWYQRIADSVLRRFPAARADRGELELALYALGGMIDDLTRKLFTTRAPEVTRLVAEVAPDDESLARFLSVMWHRALYGADPPAREAGGVLRRLGSAYRGRGGRRS